MIRKKKEASVKALPPFSEREDRLGSYWKKHLEQFVFDELSPSYLEKEGLTEILTGVPIPLRAEDLAAFKEGGLKILCVAENMAWIIGVDPKFRYAKNYMAYMRKYFNEKIVEAMVKEGRDLAEENRMEEAVIHFRAALCLSPDNLHAMYSYARGCRELYLAAEERDEEEYDQEYAEYVAKCKAESMEYFELTTEVHPSFAQSYYFLGYAYLNMGLYRKASFTFEEFLKRSRNPEDRKEVKDRLNQLEQPVLIEDGVNEVLAGRWQKGIAALEPFLESQFQDWWPLHYYLGAAYVRLGLEDSAKEAFLQVLKLNPSHVETMEELAMIYEESGESKLAEKYRRKAQLVRSREEG